MAQNNALRTRVSELEVINDLFRGRVGELEAGEQEARRNERAKDEEVQRLQAELLAASARAADMERRLAELEGTEPVRKRIRTESASVERSHEGTPAPQSAEALA